MSICEETNIDKVGRFEYKGLLTFDFDFFVCVCYNVKSNFSKSLSPNKSRLHWMKLIFFLL